MVPQEIEKGRKVSNAEFAEIYIKRNTFHGEWNYEIHPRPLSETTITKIGGLLFCTA